MAYVASCLLVKVASAAVIDAVFDKVFNQGPGTFVGGIPLSGDGSEPATYAAAYYAAADETMAFVWQQMANGTLPAADAYVEGLEWGVDGVPSEQDVLDAVADKGMIVDNKANGTSSLAHFNAVITSENLMQVS